MTTKILTPLRQTQQLNAATATNAYDTGELETMLNETDSQAQRDVGLTQFLSPALLARILNTGAVEEKGVPGLTSNHNETLACDAA